MVRSRLPVSASPSEASCVSTALTTDEQGDFSSPLLQVGTYSVAITASGFQSQTSPASESALEVQDRVHMGFKMLGALPNIRNIYLPDGILHKIYNQNSARLLNMATG